ncbi:MAG: undecaprenyldiphospho-muramoylpentapeptide beta-N-acetylglucosaminyltransferase [Trichloromonas sp.]|jgi:UDP-N-acetylglucosamine--N-acetylmuramyl-(pentapeptide) pyrophosphoryl-undecaprenol N-acetylglucosamine transferase|nr:undecaprenyldiphospho-muramoylpentapeptide beta-N-acetylglucosaminyltransferase [Trichloromonas sp.]
MKLLLAGGGTGGHLFPAVALAQRLLANEAGSEVLFVGTAQGIEARILPELGLPLATIKIGGLVGKGLLRQLAMGPRLLASVRQSWRILKKFRPDVVVGVGGYASGPVLLAAKLLGLPTLIHEQNAALGLTNRLLGRWVDRVCLSFDETHCSLSSARMVVTGNPLRLGMDDCPPLPNGDPHLLVFGGSRGARAINQAVTAMLPHLESYRGRLHILHQTGAEDLEAVRAGYRQAGWDAAGVVPFIDDMPAAYAQSHLVLCRAGATSLAELTACGRPAILIPYPHAAADHQTANAQALAARGAALMLPQSEMTPEVLAQLVGDLLGNRERLLDMAGSAWALGKKGAAERILEECRAIRR